MGFGGSQLLSEFERRGESYFEEYQTELGEAPIDRPYEFCGMIKQSNGEEKRIMDFKTGTVFPTQAQLLWASSSRRASSSQSTPEPLWATSSPRSQSARSSRSALRNWPPLLVVLLIASTGKLGSRRRCACSNSVTGRSPQWLLLLASWSISSITTNDTACQWA